MPGSDFIKKSGVTVEAALSRRTQFLFQCAKLGWQAFYTCLYTWKSHCFATFATIQIFKSHIGIGLDRQLGAGCGGGMGQPSLNWSLHLVKVGSLCGCNASGQWPAAAWWSKMRELNLCFSTGFPLRRLGVVLTVLPPLQSKFPASYEFT